METSVQLVVLERKGLDLDYLFNPWKTIMFRFTGHQKPCFVKFYSEISGISKYNTLMNLSKT